MNAKSLIRGALSALTMGVVVGSSTGHAQLTTAQKEDIGFTALQAKLGASMPTGSGISVSQVEAQEAGGNYRPSTTVFTDKNFIYGSGGSTGASGHATTVGRYFYGSSSLAPNIGVSSSRVTVYDASGFIGSDFLNTSNTGALPGVESNDIQNHSWVGSLSTTAQDVDALRRMDYAIQRDDFVATFGLNNGSGTTVPSLMAGSYNGIVVGRSDGQHSRGGITLDGGFRTRPDIVVPTSATSWAAPTVGSAAALLLETSKNTAGLANASKSVVVKSLLFTGATRNEAEFGGAWSHTSTQPLDAVYGAGELNVLHSHDILVAGQQNAASAATVGSTGWDLGNSSSTVPQLYFFDLGSENSLFEIAASLVWNRDITVADTQRGPGVNYTFTPSLANLNLRLFSANGFMLDSELMASVSENDNVELILASGLAPGRYAWQVSSDKSNIQYGFSWNVEGITAVAVPEPSVWMLVGAWVLVFRRKRR
ncbi:MAG: hypothetical protein ABJQ29_03995 [Luteolibacter sp.]